MTAVIYILICVLYFVCVALDITIFFLQIRLIMFWRQIKWLVPFETCGRPIVDSITMEVPRFLKTKQPMSEKGKLIAALAAFALVRIVLGMILGIK